MLLPNPAPNTVLNRSIKVATAYDGSSISEPHKVVGPLAQNINSTKLVGGRKVVVPLTETLGEGGHFLKFHLPNTSGDFVNDSTLYVTFAKKDSNYVDGYKDYNTNVPSAYIDSLKMWIDNGQTPNTTGEERTRYLTFSAYGRETNQPENAIVFKVAFSYVGVTDDEGETDDGDQVALGNATNGGGGTGNGNGQVPTGFDSQGNPVSVINPNQGINFNR